MSEGGERGERGGEEGMRYTQHDGCQNTGRGPDSSPNYGGRWFGGLGWGGGQVERPHANGEWCGSMRSPRSSSCSNPAGFQLGGSTSRPRFHVPAPGFTSRLHAPTPAPRPDPGSTPRPRLHAPTPAPRPDPGSTPRPRLHVPAPAFPTVPLPPWLFFGRLGSVP
uniref:Uncharacterized protein n=1 Tax=Knipowitschia caucasica TaxID=637954 RepID=A0AAV2LBQ7_KNICA